MNENVIIKTENLCKNYKNTVALKSINLCVKKGQIYGLIGANGAGKTTLIRLITGLIKPTDGHIYLNGKTSESDLSKERKNIGCIIEGPAFFPNLTAKQNLEYYTINYGTKDTNVEELLKKVHLENTDNKQYKNFSLGMKQRLGIALSLMNNPEIILLDEPINGLDPMGIIEIRELLKELSCEGKTVIISSHILSELAQVATEYGILSHGELIKELSSKQLEEECQSFILLNTSSSDDELSKLDSSIKVQRIDSDKVKLISNLEVKDIVPILVKEKISVNGIYKTMLSLEDYFLSITTRR